MHLLRIPELTRAFTPIVLPHSVLNNQLDTGSILQTLNRDTENHVDPFMLVTNQMTRHFVHGYFNHHARG